MSEMLELEAGGEDDDVGGSHLVLGAAHRVEGEYPLLPGLAVLLPVSIPVTVLTLVRDPTTFFPHPVSGVGAELRPPVLAQIPGNLS